jgi:hypothetical protein
MDRKKIEKIWQEEEKSKKDGMERQRNGVSKRKSIRVRIL